MNKNSKIVKPMGQLITFNPTGEYYFSKGIKAYHRKDYYKSLKYLQRAMQLEPGEPMIVCQLAILYADIGEYQKSNKLLHLVLEELDEEMVECYYFLANNYAHLGFFKDAYYHANLYLKLDKNGEFVEETEDLLEVLTLETDELHEEEPYEEDDLINRQEEARQLLESGHFPKAVEMLTKVIQDYPEYWSAYNNLALAYFYLGEVEKANNILDEVFEKNVGNLHALCNKLVFAYYENEQSNVKQLTDILQKIKPISTDHQFKLGTTFALVGEYGSAFFWLKKLHKQGFAGDASFYYWFSYAAYYTGRENLAAILWEKVVAENPEKKGYEPWNKREDKVNGFEDNLTSIIKRLESNHLEERLFALFLTSISSYKEKILSAKNIQENQVLSPLEVQYLSFVKTGYKIEDPLLLSAHSTAEMMYKKHQPIGTVEAGLYLMWFSVFIELHKAGVTMKNSSAWAAAMDYIWHKYRDEKISQQETADSYGLSPSTLQRYIKLIKQHLS
ncbi:tetratricopeptide repeat protein [Niallia sp. 01092]|uniref:tetratricopeptide repeat protein n=1 Tax=unclassified Niallia TaxID=2837522 RepID=UPI003FD3D8B8